MDSRAESFEVILGTDAMTALAVFVAWWVAGCVVGRLVFRRTRGRLRLGAWISMAFLGLAGAAVVAKLVNLWQLGSYGRLFVADRGLIGLPLLLLPASAALAFSAPRLWKLARIGEKRASVDALGRGAASDPLLVVPVQATAIGGALLVYLTLLPPGLPSPGLALTLWALMICGSGALWVRQQGRRRMVSGPGAPAGPGFGTRLPRATAPVLALCAGFAGWFVYSMQASVLPESFSMMAHESVDFGGGSEFAHARNHDRKVSLTELSGPKDEEPDRRFVLTARKATIKLSSGKTVKAWTFDGKAPDRSCASSGESSSRLPSSTRVSNMV